MKWSRYNIIINNGDEKYLLYNYSTDSVIIFIENVKEIVCKNVDNIDSIKKIHPSLYKCLTDKDFIIPDSMDEIEMVIKKKEKELSSEEYFRLTLNPTMNCNLKCWYCYETHDAKSHMTNRLIRSIESLLKNKIEDKKIKDVAISFFGGEPLLKIKSTAIPLIFFAQKLCLENKTNLHIGFTSNAVLLIPKITDILASTKLDIIIQVALDGDKKFHDKVKKFSDGKGSYDIVVNNIKYAITKGLKVKVRCNYTSENIDSFRNLIQEFKDCSEENKFNLRFSFHQIWQTKDNREFISPILKELKSMLIKYNIDYDRSNQLEQTDFCYADRTDSIVVNFNGDIFKCTARDFRTEYREGILNNDGTITYNERYKKRMDLRFSKETCRDCIVLPICNVCSQKKIERSLKSKCAARMSDEDKNIMIRERLEVLGANGIIET
jgi:uncharacterized protein